MKIAIAHNQYQFRGGEDAVVEQEFNLLARNGHNVIKYVVSNDSINSFISKASVFLNLAYSNSSRKSFYKFLVHEKPDIVHVHNFFPLLTPSIFDACQELSIPVIMTVHNFRLICPSGLLFHNNIIYEKAIKHGAMSTVFDKVYRNSYIGSFALARMIIYHQKMNTWSTKIDKIICLTEFQKNKFQEAGFDVSNFVLKPNFKFSSSLDFSSSRQQKALYIGRLSEEKGLRLLVEAFSELDIELEIAGSGPLEPLIKNLPKNITYLGNLSSEHVSRQMLNSKCLVLPSLWFEGFPMVILEALSHGLPVICSDIGSMKEVVRDGFTGLHFSTGNKDSLKEKVVKLFSDDSLFSCLSENAIKDFNSLYSESVNYHQLLGIYQDAIEAR